MRTKFALMLAVAALAAVPSFAAEEKFVISGKVLDHAHKPVSGVSLKLFDRHGHSMDSESSASDGSFSLAHRSCKSCSLAVVPPERHHLASAFLNNIPGEGNRNFVISLQRGFVISGRVLHGDRALKGVAVAAVSTGDTTDSDSHVHSGGKAISARDGHFHMTLTPGEKKLEVINNKYSDLVAHVEQKLSVTGDAEIGDIQVPSSR